MRRSRSWGRLSAALVGVLFGALGCGGDDDPFGELESDPFPELDSESDFGSGQSIDEEQAAQATLNSAVGLGSVTDDPEQAMAALSSAYSGAAGMLGSALDEGNFLVADRERFAGLFRRGSGDVFLAGYPECVAVEESATSVLMTFDCDESQSGLTATVDGTIGVETDGGTTTFSVRIYAAATGNLEGISLDLDAAYIGDLVISPEAIAGELLFSADLRQSYQGQSASISFLGKVIYDVVLSKPGCAVDGDIRVAVELDVNTPEASGSFSGVGQALFGPGCNQVAVYARATGT